MMSSCKRWQKKAMVRSQPVSSRISDKEHSRITSQGFREAIDVRIIPDIFLDDDRLSLEPSF